MSVVSTGKVVAIAASPLAGAFGAGYIVWGRS